MLDVDVVSPLKPVNRCLALSTQVLVDCVLVLLVLILELNLASLAEVNLRVVVSLPSLFAENKNIDLLNVFTESAQSIVKLELVVLVPPERLLLLARLEEAETRLL